MVVIVNTENMSMVWAASFHLTLVLVELRGFNNAHVHRKNRTTTIPRVFGEKY